MPMQKRSDPIASRRTGLMGGLACLCGALFFAPVIPQAFGAAGKSVDGYDGYRFGMTIEQALRVNPAAKLAPCDDADATACLAYATAISNLSAFVAVQFSGAIPRISKILLTIDVDNNGQSHHCQSVGREISTLLTDTYGASS